MSDKEREEEEDEEVLFGDLDEDEYVPPGEAPEPAPGDDEAAEVDAAVDEALEREETGEEEPAPYEEPDEDLELEDVVGEEEPEEPEEPSPEDLDVDEVVAEEGAPEVEEGELDEEEIIVAEPDEPVEEDLSLEEIVAERDPQPEAEGDLETEDVLGPREEPAAEAGAGETGQALEQASTAPEVTETEPEVPPPTRTGEAPVTRTEAEPAAETIDDGTAMVAVGSLVTLVSLAGLLWYLVADRGAFVPLAGVDVAAWLFFPIPLLIGVVLLGAGAARRARVARPAAARPSAPQDAFEQELEDLFRLGWGWNLARIAGLVLLVAGLGLWYQYSIALGSQAFLIAYQGIQVASTTLFSTMAFLGIVLIVVAQVVKASRGRLRDRVLLAYQDREIERLRRDE